MSNAKEMKTQQAEQLKKKIEQSNVIAILDVHKMPSKQYQEIYRSIRGDVEVMMVKNSVLTHALEGVSKPNIKEFEKMIPKQPALMFTRLDPFKFYMNATKMKSPTYAKEGDTAEDEILVSAGPTGLMPGPVISEFSKVGIPAGVEEGKIAVKKDKVVAKAGDKISKDLANVLRKLKIQPIKLSLNIVAVYDNGTIYQKDVLSLAGQGYVNQLVQAHQHAMNLSVAAGYPTKDNIKLLIAKAHRESQAVASKVKDVAPAAPEPAKKEEKPAEQAPTPATETPKNDQTQTGSS
jgi:large subunit ribosomal protein L10